MSWIGFGLSVIEIFALSILLCRFRVSYYVYFAVPVSPAIYAFWYSSVQGLLLQLSWSLYFVALISFLFLFGLRLVRYRGVHRPTKPVEPTGTGRLLLDPPPNHVILLLG